MVDTTPLRTTPHHTSGTGHPCGRARWGLSAHMRAPDRTHKYVRLSLIACLPSPPHTSLQCAFDKPYQSILAPQNRRWVARARRFPLASSAFLVTPSARCASITLQTCIGWGVIIGVGQHAQPLKCTDHQWRTHCAVCHTPGWHCRATACMARRPLFRSSGMGTGWRPSLGSTARCMPLV